MSVEAKKAAPIIPIETADKAKTEGEKVISDTKLKIQQAHKDIGSSINTAKDFRDRLNLLKSEIGVYKTRAAAHLEKAEVKDVKDALKVVEDEVDSGIATPPPEINKTETLLGAGLAPLVMATKWVTGVAGPRLAEGGHIFHDYIVTPAGIVLKTLGKPVILPLAWLVERTGNKELGATMRGWVGNTNSPEQQEKLRSANEYNELQLAMENQGLEIQPKLPKDKPLSQEMEDKMDRVRASIGTLTGARSADMNKLIAKIAKELGGTPGGTPLKPVSIDDVIQKARLLGTAPEVSLEEVAKKKYDALSGKLKGKKIELPALPAVIDAAAAGVVEGNVGKIEAVIKEVVTKKSLTEEAALAAIHDKIDPAGPGGNKTVTIEKFIEVAKKTAE